MSEQKLSARDKLLRDMKVTKGVRFNASERLEREERNLTRNVAYASTAVVVVTLVPFFFDISEHLERVVAIMTVALSIFILAVSLLQSASGRPVRANKLERCAMEVNSLRRELEATVVDGDVSSYAKRYDDIIAKYGVMHERQDYNRYRIDHVDEYSHLDAEEHKKIRREVRRTEIYPGVARIVITVMCILVFLVAIVQRMDATEYFGLAGVVGAGDHGERSDR